MKIAIIDIIGLPYDGTTVYKQGLGGSESAVTFMAYELAQIGFDVTVFNNCDIDSARAGNYSGVTYRPLGDLTQNHRFDVVISSRTIIPFTDPADYPKLNDNRAFALQSYNMYDRIVAHAPMRILWMHDTFCLGDNLIEELALADRITDIFTLSDFHLTYVTNCHHGRRRNFEVLKRKMFITRNGAKSYRSEIDIQAKDKDLFVYNASVTKGMIPLVNEIWPRVKQQIPSARLKVIGGYYRFSSQSEPDAQEQDWRRMVADPKYNNMGIDFTGVIPQSEIADILTAANFMIYPCAFPETFGISTLESLLYNTPVLTCRFGALEEIAVNGASYLIDYAVEPNGLFPDINLPQQVDKFVEMTVAAYRNPYLHQQKQYYCNIVKPIAGWDSVAMQWKQFFYRRLGLFMSRSDYRAASIINHQVHKVWKRRFQNAVEFESYKRGNEQKIVAVSTFYNCQDYITRCIDSIATQDYDNYQCILVNDCSTDATAERVAGAIAALPADIQAKFTVINNTERQGAVYNQVAVFRAIDDPEAIVMIIDGDDSLVNDNSIFSYFNSVYDGSTEFTYGSCWSMVDHIPLISQPYPEKIKQARAYRQHRFNWIMPYTHLRTFKQHLITGIPDSNFQDTTGAWFRAGGDGSTFYSLIEAADPNKVKCLQEVVYNYNDINPLNDYKVNSDEQTRNAQIISNRNVVEKYSVIVPTMWRINDQFLPFVRQLCQHPAVGEVIIINNDNTKTPEGLSDFKIKMFDFGKNIYVNPAWNYGVDVSRYDRLCIVNDDVVFDLAVFERLQYLLSESTGLYGLCPGVSDFNQPPVTDGMIDIIPWTGQHTYGYGSLFFLHKKSWSAIPEGLDLYFGDNYIFDLQLAQRKTNYMITNMNFVTPFAVTTSDTSISGGMLERERPIYEKVRMEMVTIPEPVAAPVPVIIPPQPMNKKRILIAIPTARNIEPDTFKSIYDLIAPDNCELVFQYFFGYNVDQVRNLIADWVVKGFDYLFSVDSDIAFDSDTLIKLLAHDRDVVSGLYIQRKPGQHVLEIYEHNGYGGVVNMPYEKLKGRPLVEIAGCGFGCVLVKGEVMREIGYPQFEYHSAIDHAHTISEDNDFCTKARNKGFKIWADPSILCRHTGSYTFTIDTTIPAINAPTPVDTNQFLRNLRVGYPYPATHINYLKGLKEAGFEPRVMYDIGACVLHWHDQVKLLWPQGRVIAFEASDGLEFLYKEAGIEYVIGVLSTETGREVEFYQNNDAPGGNSYYRENPDVQPSAAKIYAEVYKRKVKTIGLDDTIRARSLPMPDLIKMDVQGAELDVLKGATEALKTAQHVILELQVVEYNKGAPLKDVVIAYMDSVGYDCLGLFSDNGPDGDYHFKRRLV
jgi:FkbM family methyltransferase